MGAAGLRGRPTRPSSVVGDRLSGIGHRAIGYRNEFSNSASMAFLPPS
jgi:hypothetical protein